MCTGCYTAHYCSKSCLRKDWEVHKQLCKEIREEFQEVHLDWDGIKIHTLKNHITGKIRIHAKASETNPAKAHNILKVQSHEDKRSWLTVYSQHDEIFGLINERNPMYSRLKTSIEEEGLFKYKIYINSCQRDGKLWINPNRILEPRTW